MVHQLMIMKNNKIVYCQYIHVNDVVQKFKSKTPKDNTAVYFLTIEESSMKYPLDLILIKVINNSLNLDNPISYQILIYCKAKLFIFSVHRSTRILAAGGRTLKIKMT